MKSVPTSDLVIQISTFAAVAQLVLAEGDMARASEEEKEAHVQNVFREVGAESEILMFLAAKTELDRRIPVE